MCESISCSWVSVDWLIDRWLKRRGSSTPLHSALGGETQTEPCRAGARGDGALFCATRARARVFTRVWARRPLTAFPHMARNNVGRPRGFQLSNYLPTHGLAILRGATAWRFRERNRCVSQRVTLEERTFLSMDFFTVVASLHHASRRYYQFRALGNVENELRRERASYNLSVWNGLSGSCLQNPYRRSTPLVPFRDARHATPRVQLPRVARIRERRSFWKGSYICTFSILFDSSSLKKNILHEEHKNSARKSVFEISRVWGRYS